MATPHVSGLAALILLYRPKLSMSQVIAARISARFRGLSRALRGAGRPLAERFKEIILDSATREDALKNSSVTGARINARNALALAATYQAELPPAPGDVMWESFKGCV